MLLQCAPNQALSENKRRPNLVGGAFSAKVPRSSAELRRVFVPHIIEVEGVGQ